MTEPQSPSQPVPTGDEEGHAVGGGALAHPAGHVPHVPQGAYETGYLVLTLVFVSMLLLTNIIGLKLFALPVDLPVLGVILRFVERVNATLFGQPEGAATLTLTAGLVTYPITFLCTDIVSEVYGRKRADRMVLLGFLASLLMLAVVQVARALVPSDFWNVPAPWSDLFRPDLVSEAVVAGQPVLVASAEAAQGAFSFAFDAPGTLLFASMTAYLAAQLVDNRLFHFWRRLTNGKHLWFRNNMSTGLSQFVDTLIVNGLFLSLYWKFDWPLIAAIILNVYVVKFLLALLDTPLCYLGVWWTRKLVRPPVS
jgi:hypothetical protein